MLENAIVCLIFHRLLAFFRRRLFLNNNLVAKDLLALVKLIYFLPWIDAVMTLFAVHRISVCSRVRTVWSHGIGRRQAKL